MSNWKYIQDVKKEELDDFCVKYTKKNPNRICRYATARSNNPGVVAVYYSEK